MDRKLAKLEKRFHKIASQLNRFDLQKLGSSENRQVTLQEVVSDLETHAGSSLFMGYYSHAGLMEVIERYGIVSTLKKLGFSNLRLQIDTNDPFRHVLRLYWEHENPERLLIELILHEGVVSPKHTRVEEQYDIVFIEWFCLQNPSAEFQPSKPRLPGQQKPGLGIAPEMVELLVIMAERLKKDGVVNIPRYYHTAHIAHAGFFFIDPRSEGVMRALERDLRGHSLAEASWAVELGLVSRLGETHPFVWTGEEQVYPISEKMKKHFESLDYKVRCREFEQFTVFRVNWNEYRHRYEGRAGHPEQETKEFNSRGE